MKTLQVAAADINALVAMLPAGLIKSPADAMFDHDAGVLTYADELDAAVQAALANLPAGRKTLLKAYAAAARYAKEIAGVTLDGKTYSTDRESQAKLTAAMAMASALADPNFTVNWKTASGFVALNPDTLKQVALAVAAHVQAAFSQEAAADAQIDAGTLTETAGIDALFAAV